MIMILKLDALWCVDVCFSPLLRSIIILLPCSVYSIADICSTGNAYAASDVACNILVWFIWIACVVLHKSHEGSARCLQGCLVGHHVLEVSTTAVYFGA